MSFIKLAQFNLENFFVYMDHPIQISLDKLSEADWQTQSISTFDNKTLHSIREIARCVRDMNADIFALCEVGGIESINNFANHFLGGEYRAFSIEGNSDRGIDLAYLVKKDLPYEIDLRTHKHRAIDFLYPHERQSVLGGYLDPKHSQKFSRDVLELRLLKNDKPEFVVLNVHLKSQLDKDNVDPLGKDRRKAELEKLLDIYDEVVAEVGAHVPVMVTGDFNGIASSFGTEPEFQKLHKKGSLVDVFDLAEIPKDERVTQLQFSPNGKCWKKQFDYIFVGQGFKDRIVKKETFVYRFKDEMGQTMNLPATLNEKRKLPSDHYPVVTCLTM